jgi:hypothetical protein
VVETDPRLRVTGPASVRDGQRHRQSLDEFVVISHASTIRRVLRTLQLGADRLTRRTTRRADLDGQAALGAEPAPHPAPRRALGERADGRIRTGDPVLTMMRMEALLGS